jgi:hypothetical protein
MKHLAPAQFVLCFNVKVARATHEFPLALGEGSRE